jgi:hypothetical protein
MRSIERQPVRRLEDGVPVETTYLDLDGDGVPDAVHIVEAIAVDRTGDGHIDVVEVIEELLSDIGDDGVPGSVDVVDHADIGLDHSTNPRRPHRLHKIAS